MADPAAASPDPVVKLNYDETIIVLDQAVGNVTTIRTNVTTILAFGTGAAAFFGLSGTQKHWPYAVSLVCYGLASLVALGVYIPIHLKLNVVMGLGTAIKADPKADPISLNDALGQITSDRQTAIAAVGTHLNDGRLRGLGGRLVLVLVLVAASVLFAGANLLLPNSSSPATPTHIVIDQQPLPSK